MKQATPGKFEANGRSLPPSVGNSPASRWSVPRSNASDIVAVIDHPGWPTNAILLLRTDQLNPATLQTLPQRIAAVRFVGNHPHRFLPGSARTVASPYPDRGARRFREPDFRRGCRVNVASQRNTHAVDHHHSLHPLAPLGFSDSAAPYFGRAKLPSGNDSHHFNGWRFSETRARYSAKRPTRPSLAIAARRSKDAGISLAGPASAPRIAESTEFLPAYGGSRSTDDRPCIVWAVEEARARFSSAALRSAMQQTAPSVLLRRC